MCWNVHGQEHVDPSLDPSTVPDLVLAVVAEVALICLAEEPSNRPHMREVVSFLQPAAAFKEETGAQNTLPSFECHSAQSAWSLCCPTHLRFKAVKTDLLLVSHCNLISLVCTLRLSLAAKGGSMAGLSILFCAHICCQGALYLDS